MKLFDTFWARIEQACFNQLPRIAEGIVALAMILLAVNISVEHVDFYHHAGALTLVPVRYIAGIIFATSTAHFLGVWLPQAFLSRRLRIWMMCVTTAELGAIAASVSSLMIWGWTWAIPGALMMTAFVIRLQAKQDARIQRNSDAHYASGRLVHNANRVDTQSDISKPKAQERRHDSSQHRAYSG